MKLMKKRIVKEDCAIKEVLLKMKEEEKKTEIRPYHDFATDTLYYGFIAGEERYLITSKKKLISFKEVDELDLKLTHANITESKISSNVIERFITNSGYKVDIYEVYQNIKKYLKPIVYLEKEEDYSVLALWTIGTYTSRIFDNCMYIWVNGEMGSGKSTLLEALSNICFNSMYITNIKQAALTRGININGNTIFFDECENLNKKEEDDTKVFMNSGNKKNSKAQKCKSQKDNFDLEYLDLYSFKMMGGINDIPGTLLDRSYIIQTKVKDKGYQEKLTKSEVNSQIQNLIDSLYLVGLTYGEDIFKLYDNPRLINIPDEITNRERDKWLPLMSIAQLIDNTHGTEISKSISTSAIENIYEQNKIKLEKNLKYRLLTGILDCLEIENDTESKDGFTIVKTDIVHNYFVKEGLMNDIGYKYLSKNILTKLLKNELGIEAKNKNYKYNKCAKAYFINKEKIESSLNELLNKVKISEI